MREKQALFMRLQAELVLYMISMGYHPVGDWFYRDKETAKRLGFENSNHTRCLAIDINLFDKDWNYLTKTEDHRIFGEWWEQRHPLCRWGGRFNDGNHYSFEHEGVI